MTTLSAPNAATYTTATPDEFVNVTCGASDVMLVTWAGPAGVSGRRTVQTTTSSGEELGPFPNGTAVTFAALAGSPVYTAPAFAEPVQSLVSGAGNFFSDTGMWSGLVSDEVAAPWAVSSHLTGKKGLLPSFGPEPLYYRDTIAAGGGQVLTQPLVRDHLGIPRQTTAGQVLTWGQRLEENLLRFSNDLTNGTYWLTANGCTVAREYSYDLPARRISGRDGPLYAERAGGYVTRVTGDTQVNSLVRVNTAQVLRAVPHVPSVYAKVRSGSQTFEVRFYVVGGATAVTSTFTLTAADGWQRLALNAATPDGTSAYVVGIAPGTYAGTGGGEVLIGGVMLQERLGSETAPSEHIITDGMPVSARWWNGLGLDRIECFGTTNGNSVTAGFAASAGGVVVEADGVALTRHGIRSSPTVQQFARTDVNNWTATRSTVATGVAAPDGTLTAYDIVEDATAGASHFVQYTLASTTTYDNQFMVFSVFAKQRSGGDRAWIYVAFQNLAGTNVGAFFNLATGAVGTVTAGLYACVEDWGNGWYRCMVRGSVGTDGAGTNTIIPRLFIAQGDNSFAQNGDTGKGVRVWCPNVTGPLSGAGTARAMPTRPALNPSTSIGIIPGSILVRDLSGSIGSTEFAASGTVALYGMIDEPYKSGTGFVYSGTLYMTSADPAVGCGISWRPGADGGITGHTLKFAGDVYVGELFDEFFWRPNTAYEVGDYVVPTDTLPTNSNGRKMFRCQVAGTSGATEPAWNTTYVPVPDTTTNVTSDGPTLKWQANINNGIDSDAEEYLGVHLKPTQTGFHQQVKWSWYQTAADYGMFLDGVEGVRQTYPQIESGVVPILPKPLRLGWYGKQDRSASLPDSAPAGYNPSAAMGVWDTDHQDLVIYHSAPTAEVLQATTA
jgi:hypothetical protein